MSNRLAGQRAAVTGGSRGIGAAIASALIAEGASVTLLGRSADKLQATADQLGAQFAVCDVTQPDQVEHTFAHIGALDILINNAGHAESAPFRRTDPALWSRMIETNLTGTYLCTRAAVSGMVERRQGRIVNIASSAGLTGYAYVTAYCAAKHGVIGLTRALALELARSGVTVNAVCPGYTETEMLAESVANIVEKTGRSADEARAQLVAANPQGRFVQPEEVASSVIWLCLPESAALTGQAIAVAGGEIL
ncbi:MAG TPA: SDR family NAD(P)-dependent oxidoreductase [Phototrophicaceae bacterium]|nr:SDR family NAD(P)-dependent oxidoreductase [Phototrophicaceae bacterium]